MSDGYWPYEPDLNLSYFWFQNSEQFCRMKNLHFFPILGQNWPTNTQPKLITLKNVLCRKRVAEFVQILPHSGQDTSRKKPCQLVFGSMKTNNKKFVQSLAFYQLKFLNFGFLCTLWESHIQQFPFSFLSSNHFQYWKTDLHKLTSSFVLRCYHRL